MVMDIMTELLRQITNFRVTFDNTPDITTRYKLLHPIFLEIGKCIEYMRNNEKYTQYTLLLETMDDAFSELYTSTYSNQAGVEEDA